MLTASAPAHELSRSNDAGRPRSSEEVAGVAIDRDQVIIEVLDRQDAGRSDILLAVGLGRRWDLVDGHPAYR
jgi:hypothetical protein